MANLTLDKKLEYWEHQLLDLGKRNKMINYRETKRTTLKLVEPSFESLYNDIAIEEKALTFKRVVDKDTDIRMYSLLALMDNLSASVEVTIGDIETECTPAELQKTLRNLRNKTRLSQEEQGTNILYLSFGFIEWLDGKGSKQKWIKSPLVLVPAVLTLPSLHSPFTLSKHEDDIVINPTLVYYLKTEYGIELPEFDCEKESLSYFLSRIEEIADQKGWRVLKETSLGLLSFLKISMYNDLLQNEERIKNNPVIKAICGDNAEINNIPDEILNYDLDKVSPADTYQVMSADSSQQDAILFSKNNISFVMQGPPGTGKSQTITNIISEALADGKKVLFVSEKMAALQVVYKRLVDAHLAEFCLPLHSYKANKKDILEQIGANLKLKQTTVKESAVNSLADLEYIRNDLNEYSKELHATVPNLNLSCYEVYSRLDTFQNIPSLVFNINDILNYSQIDLQNRVNVIDNFELAYNRLTIAPQSNPWDGIKPQNCTYEFKQNTERALSAFKKYLLTLNQVMSEVFSSNDINHFVKYNEIDSLFNLVRQVLSFPDVPTNWVSESDLEEIRTLAQSAKELYSSKKSDKEQVANIFNENVYQYDYNEWLNILSQNVDGIIHVGLFKNDNISFYYDNCFSLTDKLKDTLCKLEQIDDDFSFINETLGTDFAKVYDNIDNVISLLQHVSGGHIFLRTWFSSEAKLRLDSLNAAQITSAIMLNIKNRIIENWEDEILSIQASDILKRYKTDYQSAFRIFNSKYKQDRKSIQALSKSVIKKLDDSVAITILEQVRDYQVHEQWFEKNQKLLEQLFGDYYVGPTTDWNKIRDLIGSVIFLQNYFNGNMPSNLIEILCASQKEDRSELIVRAKNIDQLYRDIDNSDINVNFVNTIHSNDFDLCATIDKVRACLDYLDKIRVNRSDIEEFVTLPNLTYNELFNGIKLLNHYSEVRNTIQSQRDRYLRDFDFLFEDDNTKWDNIIEIINGFVDIQNNHHYVYVAHLMNLPDGDKKTVSDALLIVKQCSEDTKSLRALYIDLFASNECVTQLTLSNLANKIFGGIDNIDELENYIDFVEAKETCKNNDLENFIDAVLRENIGKEFSQHFLKGFYQMWISAAYQTLTAVRKFRRNQQDERVAKFSKLDDMQLAIAQMRIREKLIANLPSGNHLLKATDEVAILNRELSKKRNIMPLRKLFRRIPNLLMKLKPCLMMSPLSVSYFLETEAYNFDLVIFDEASQIFPEDAIGAIFRGSQVIIAGDTKQLPPTNFFATTTSNFDGDYDIDDEEDEDLPIADSILEEAAAVLPNRTLLWHYRSKDESLIAFSNREIYKNELITFPNSVSNIADMGVEYIYVSDGVYEGKGRNCNVKEAKRCVELVEEHINKYPNRSLGIIAFSERQQNAIENAIDQFREHHPEYEDFFNDSKEEPFFVKNLENVQGDERDTIIFSICYAKDANGKMYMRFGPLGHNGGERRLNVAITRAKCNVKLVGSILPSDIDLNRTNSEGVRMLRSYIEFAKFGNSALKPVSNYVEEKHDAFCDRVEEFLEYNGYTVVRNLGCSDYKIDIAVENPNVEGEYIAAIECDGYSYVQTRTVRDRDHLRRSVLENMGWNTYRVWSTEWNKNPDAEKEALIVFLSSVIDENGNTRHKIHLSNNNAIINVNDIATESIREQKTTTHNDNPYGFEYYQVANIWSFDATGGDNFTRIAQRIEYVLQVEQPMHLELLYKRLGPSFTAGKATKDVRYTINLVIKERLKNKVIIENDFIRLLPIVPATVRVPQKYAWDSEKRPMDFIHTEEVARAMLRIIHNSYGISSNALSAECAKTFGYERMGPKIKTKTDEAIRYLLEKQVIKIIEDKIQIIGEL